jgi:hypothetical protein
MKRLIPFILILLCFQVKAQNEVDALRYSLTYPGGTARSSAMAGAFTAAGADFYSASSNPAGLGLYRKGGEITFTPEFYYNVTDSRYFGNELSDSRLNFNLNNFGYVSSFQANESGFIGGSFAFGFNRINNFHSKMSLSGINHFNSMAHSMVESANNNGNPFGIDDLLPFDEWLFYDGIVMDNDAEGYYFVHPDLEVSLNDPAAGIEQAQYSETTGRMNEWVFSTGFNIDHFLYLGATLGLTPVRYEEEVTYSERDGFDRAYEMFDYNTSMETSGLGINGKFGFILRPLPFLRIGGSLQTPTSYSLDMTYTAVLHSRYTDWININPQDENGNYIDYGESEFTLVTPGKVSGGVSATLGTFGMINADVEYINYSRMRLSRTFEADANRVIDNIYQPVLNLKGGAEFRISQVYLRGGYAYYPSPFIEGELNEDANKHLITSGIGFREESFFFDFTYMYQFSDEKSILYFVDGRPNTANFDIKTSRFMTTIGFKF